MTPEQEKSMLEAAAAKDIDRVREIVAEAGLTGRAAEMMVIVAMHPEWDALEDTNFTIRFHVRPGRPMLYEVVDDPEDPEG